MWEGERRPRPADVADEQTLLRWYWLKSELVEMARRAHLSTAGGKIELTQRIAAHFAGREMAPATRVDRTDKLPAALTGDTLIQPGQRCTQALRQWMRDRVGSSFTFDAATRSAVAAGGLTLNDLETLWRQPRPITEPAEQFELNRFSRSWHHGHPGGSHADMLAAWKTHRSRPRDW
ncbi:MAG: hypothetical protein ABWZ36_00975 [Jiangellaceae bacterium]